MIQMMNEMNLTVKLLEIDLDDCDQRAKGNDDGSKDQSKLSEEKVLAW